LEGVEGEVVDEEIWEDTRESLRLMGMGKQGRRVEVKFMVEICCLIKKIHLISLEQPLFRFCS